MKKSARNSSRATPKGHGEVHDQTLAADAPAPDARWARPIRSATTSRYPSCSVRLFEKGYARQRHPPFARACEDADRLCLASLAAQAFSAEAASVVRQKPDRVAHVVVTAVGIAAHSQLPTTVPIPT